MSRDIYFFKKDTVVAPMLNASGNEENAFDANIRVINAMIQKLSDDIKAQNKYLGNVIIELNANISLRDNLRAGAKSARKRYNNEISRLEKSRDAVHGGILTMERELKTLREVDLPKATALKAENELSKYNQTFADKGIDSKYNAEQLRLKADADKALAESVSKLKKLQTESSLKIQEQTSKNTRTIVISIVVMVVLITSVLVFKKLKRK